MTKNKKLLKFAIDIDNNGLPYDQVYNAYLNAIKNFSGWIANVPNKYRDEIMCEIAVKDNPRVIRTILESFRSHDICLMAIKYDITFYKYVPSHVKTYNFLIKAINLGCHCYRIPREWLFRYSEYYKLNGKYHSCRTIIGCYDDIFIFNYYLIKGTYSRCSNEASRPFYIGITQLKKMRNVFLFIKN